MPTLYWGPWLAKIRRGGPELCIDQRPATKFKKFKLQLSFLVI
jgi:hypothetical protein